MNKILLIVTMAVALFTTEASARVNKQHPVSPVVIESTYITNDNNGPLAVFLQEVNKQSNTTNNNRVKGDGKLSQAAIAHLGETARQLGLPRSLWCADFLNKLVGGNDRRAVSFLERGTPAPYGCTECVAITRRKGGHHVGVVIDYDKNGNPILISGNHNRQVGIGTYSRGVVLGYRYITT